MVAGVTHVHAAHGVPGRGDEGVRVDQQGVEAGDGRDPRGDRPRLQLPVALVAPRQGRIVRERVVDEAPALPADAVGDHHRAAQVEVEPRDPDRRQRRLDDRVRRGGVGPGLAAEDHRSALRRREGAEQAGPHVDAVGVRAEAVAGGVRQVRDATGGLRPHQHAAGATAPRTHDQGRGRDDLLLERRAPLVGPGQLHLPGTGRRARHRVHAVQQPHLQQTRRLGGLEVGDVERLLAAVVDPEGAVAIGVGRLHLTPQLTQREAPVHRHRDALDVEAGGLRPTLELPRGRVVRAVDDAVGRGLQTQHPGDRGVVPDHLVVVERGRELVLEHRPGGLQGHALVRQRATAVADPAHDRHRRSEERVEQAGVGRERHGATEEPRRGPVEEGALVDRLDRREGVAVRSAGPAAALLQQRDGNTGLREAQRGDRSTEARADDHDAPLLTGQANPRRRRAGARPDRRCDGRHPSRGEDGATGGDGRRALALGRHATKVYTCLV